MKAQDIHSLSRTLGRLLDAGERHGRRSGRPPSVPLYEEMGRSAWIGLGACLAYALVAGSPAVALAPLVLLGYCGGAVIGLVLWSSSDHLPEDPVLPPAPGQERYAVCSGA